MDPEAGELSFDEGDGDLQAIQESQYVFPYHYLPRYRDGRYRQTETWTWGMHYLGGIKVVLDRLDRLEFQSLVDVGCGDGRLLHELRRRYPDVELVGIDRSERAIRWARAFNPGEHLLVRDIIREPIEATFGVVTLIEVLEHIPTSDILTFVDRTAAMVEEDGMLVVTVPHSNRAVTEKHYQHFDRSDCEDLFSRHFEALEFFPFDRRSVVLEAVRMLVGGRGHHFVLTNEQLLGRIFEWYLDRMLYVEDESRCTRLAMVARR